MIIIIEGPDGSGKTRLAEQLSKQTGYKIRHRSKPETEEERTKMMDDYLVDIRSNKNIIWDRSFYSEMVYGNVMRDKSYINWTQMLQLETELANVGAIIIHCTADILKLWDRCKSRGEDYIKDIDKLEAIRDGFEELLTKRPHNIPVVNYKVYE
jgi:thymidylate kinase